MSVPIVVQARLIFVVRLRNFSETLKRRGSDKVFGMCSAILNPFKSPFPYSFDHYNRGG